MNQTIKQIAVIARRDFLAVVATPTFLVFLFAPFFMFAISAGGGLGLATLAKSGGDTKQLSVIANAQDSARLKAEDIDLRKRIYGDGPAPPALHFMTPAKNTSQQITQLIARKDVETIAVMAGPIAKPAIHYQKDAARSARYLALLAEQTLRSAALETIPNQTFSQATLSEINQIAPTKSRQKSTGSGAVFVIFILTLLLAGQAAGMMAEEKSNKVLEILAAAVPLEAVFFGKLLGLFCIALSFVAFWGALAAIGITFIPASLNLTSFVPVVGTPTFILLGAAYFTMAFMLLGAIFLGIGAQASTIREIQMLSLPITVVQLAVFALSSAAAGRPDSNIATFAQIFPFSSPFAMAARAATDDALWPHAVALCWQALWVGLTIFLAARLFRMGVLNAGGGIRGFFARSRTKMAV